MKSSEGFRCRALFTASLQKGTCLALASEKVVKVKNVASFPVSEPSNRSDEGAFDIITEEEVNGVYDSDATSQTVSLDGEQDRHPQEALNM